uniref:Ig-like domain-containing protein n=1 Tax=Strigamia maritima TaxID=126957 RepID=T1IVY5_STRMM
MAHLNGSILHPGSYQSIYTTLFILLSTSISTGVHFFYHKTVEAGSNVTLTCPIFDGLVPVVWSRFPNASLMSDRTTIRRSEDVSELQVRNANWMDAGIYRCQGDNSLFATTRLTVTCKTIQRRQHAVLTKSTELVIQQGDDVQLDCNAVFNANWRRKTSRGVEEHIYSARQLNICNVQTTDAGVYSCSADDDQRLEQLVRNIRLIVEYVPAVNSPWPQVRQALNYSSHLECVIDAFPTASVVWFKDDEPLNDTSRYQQSMQTRGTAATTFASTLVVLRTDYSDYGNYTCRAVNALGISAFTLQLGRK